MKTALFAILFVSGVAHADSSKVPAKDAPQGRAKLEAEAPAEWLLRTKDAPPTNKGESVRVQSKKTRY